VLVTGATGFIGGHLAEELLRRGMAVRCLTRSGKPLPDGAERAAGDVLSGEGLDRALDGVDVVYHLAGATKALSESDYVQGNVRTTEVLVSACERAGVPRFLHVSSLAAAGPSPDGRLLSEDDEPRPVSRYGRSKLEGEWRVLRSRIAERAVIIRPPVVYGPRDTDMLAVFRMAARGWVVTIGPEESWFSYIHVADLAAGLIDAATKAPPGTYYLSNPDPVSWPEFGRQTCGRVREIHLPVWAAQAAGAAAEAVAWVRSQPSILSRDKVREGRWPYWTCDPARAAESFGFRARMTLEEGIAQTMAWYRKAGWLS
jgi:nucleoside-diphosphate-sugar epimerase